ncbi:MAG: VWA domain-containing protein [Acidimicrobiia bacterium]
MSSPARSTSRRRGDEGVTLVELLIGVTILGVIMATLSAAVILILKAQKPIQARIAEAKDIAFLQTWLPVDLSSATSSDTTPTLQPLAGTTLPGTNVVTLTRADGAGGASYEVAYRYETTGVEWVLARYEIRGAQVKRIIVAHELPSPPAGWTPDQPPTHALSLVARNQRVVQPVGSDLAVVFSSGNIFSTGGSGLAMGDALPTDYSGGIADPAAPRSRCGGTIALVLDTSGSVPNQGGDGALKSAAKSFVDAFTGTPSRMTLVGFDYSAYQMYPSSGFGNYVSVLNPSSEVTAAKNRINNIVWNQTGAATNWEDALWRTFRANNGTTLATVPDLVVFITDGDPNRNRTSSSQIDGRIDTADVSRAVDAANFGRGTGARVIGVLVGATAKSTASVNRLKQVVGSVQWNGTNASNPGNAATADLFIPAKNGAFSELGNVLRAISAAECGGTVTVQKRIMDGAGNLSLSTQPWSYTTDTGVQDLDPSRSSSITFDYQFAKNVTERTVEIIEQPADGYVLDRIDCSSFGVPFDAARMGPAAAGAPGVALRLRPDEAVSCTFVSRST